jgi:hypothetical protein
MDWAGLNERGMLSAEELAPLTQIDELVVTSLKRLLTFDVVLPVKEALQKVQQQLAVEAWEQQVAAVRFGLLWRETEGSGEQEVEGVGGRQRRRCSTGSAAAAAAATAVQGEGATAGGEGSCVLVEEQQQLQQQQLMSALCVLACRSQRSTEL